MFYHRIFTITFSYHRAIREFLAQDEVEFKGYSDKRTTGTWTAVAPSKAVALAHFHEKDGFTDEQKMTIDAVEEKSLDAFIQQVGLR